MKITYLHKIYILQHLQRLNIKYYATGSAKWLIKYSKEIFSPDFIDFQVNSSYCMISNYQVNSDRITWSSPKVLLVQIMHFIIKRLKNIESDVIHLFCTAFII